MTQATLCTVCGLADESYGFPVPTRSTAATNATNRKYVFEDDHDLEETVSLVLLVNS